MVIKALMCFVLDVRGLILDCAGEKIGFREEAVGLCMDGRSMKRGCAPFSRRRRLNTALTKDQAVEIFKTICHEMNFAKVNQQCRDLVLRFNVNKKTIRDIWAGRTWRHETFRQPINHRASMSHVQPPPNINGPFNDEFHSCFLKSLL
mmetsp:Transcript_41402/g.110783  ORF Transcript_41402/g.110783 Transcript_41402/m.110783 type:complete len:148 (+) Transcript_41402:105-548(+)